jgi:CTP:molybdopterin cytidylyltransferase MocA
VSVTAAVLLAAGEAHARAALALAPVGGGQTRLEWQIGELKAAGIDVIEVVIGHDAEAVLPLVAGEDVEPVVTARWQDEASSLRMGAQATPRDTVRAVIVDARVPVDAGAVRRALEGGPGADEAPLVVDAGGLTQLRNRGRLTAHPAR